MAFSADRLAIVGGDIVTPQGIVSGGTLLVEDGKILAITSSGVADPEPGSRVIDASGGYVMPGFVDTHVHGSGGEDVMAGGAESIGRASRSMARFGTTAWLPTTIAARHDEILSAIDSINEAGVLPPNGARVLGIHLEGPYINRRFKGAQPDEGIRDPDFDELRELLAEAQGSIKVMTLAPELPGATELIRVLRENNIVASLGHSECDYDTALAAIEAGATYATHLFNAMSGVHHRAPGLAACCLNEKGIVAELILDGVHLDPRMANLAWKAKGPDEIALVTDAIAAQGCGDGAYHLGKFQVNVSGALCTLTDGKTIAGSVLTMNRAVANAVSFTGANIVEVARSASLVPARRCRIDDRKGSLEAGKDADITILSRQFQVSHTVVEGQLVYARQ